MVATLVLGSLAAATLPAASGEERRTSLVSASWASCPEDTPTADFEDRHQARSPHLRNIDCIAAHGITVGTQADGRRSLYRPAGIVNRAQMATFVARTLEAGGFTLPDASDAQQFSDVADSVHRRSINGLAQTNIILGYPDGTYRPQQPVTRAQMATFMVQAAAWTMGEDLSAGGGPYFSDTAGSVHERNIDAGFEAGLFAGRVAPTPGTDRSGRFDPGAGTRRDQMATFLINFLGLVDSGGDVGELVVRPVLAGVTDAPTMPLTAGVIVYVDGQEVGTTDDSGTLTITRLPGTYEVRAVIPSLAAGATTASVTAGATTNVEVNLDDSKSVAEPAELELDELVNGGLPLDTDTLTLRFEDGQTGVAVSDIAWVELDATNPHFDPIDLTDAFTVTGSGAVVAADMEAVLAAIAGVHSDAVLRVNAVDARGFTYNDAVEFTTGVFDVRVKLVAPPSRLSLNVAGIPVRAEYGDRIVEEGTADPTGTVVFSSVPAGPLTVSAETQEHGQVYSGFAQIPIDTTRDLAVGMLAVDDVRADVQPWTLEADSTLYPTTTAAPDPSPQQPPPTTSTTDNSACETTARAAIFAVQPATATCTVDIPQGTRHLKLTYEVVADRFLDRIFNQPGTIPQRDRRGDDNWSLRVLSGAGSTLFSTGRSINSQLHDHPSWNTQGRTGRIRQTIDVASLTADGEASFTVTVTVADADGVSRIPTSDSITTFNGRLLTRVEVEVEPEPEEPDPHLHITRVGGGTHNPVDCSPHTVRGQVRTGANLQTAYSIPRQEAESQVANRVFNDTNVCQRSITVAYDKSDDVTLTHVEATLLDGEGAELDELVSEGPDGNQVERSGERELSVEVTYSGGDGSQVESAPPPTDGIRYEITLRGVTGEGEVIESDSMQSGAFHALWRMPDVFRHQRFGDPDPGGDDWVAQCTYTWLEENEDLVTRINDISGEHARNIGHDEHVTGRDIDMFHVYTFPGGEARGGANYWRLVLATRGALNGEQVHLDRLNDWAVQTRERFEDLFEAGQVARIIYARGIAHNDAQPHLTEGWAESLLRDGNYANEHGLEIELPAGAWETPRSLRFDNQHNTHFHVQLGC
jgi:hypothetical protein